VFNALSGIESTYNLGHLIQLNLVKSTIFTFCTSFLTTDAWSLGQDILKTVGPGHGIKDNTTSAST